MYLIFLSNILFTGLLNIVLKHTGPRTVSGKVYTHHVHCTAFEEALYTQCIIYFIYFKIYLSNVYIFRYASTSAPSGSSGHDSGALNFFGTGYKLGQTENDTEG